MKDGQKTIFDNLPIGAPHRQFDSDGQIVIKVSHNKYAFPHDLSHTYGCADMRDRVCYYAVTAKYTMRDWNDAMAILKACLTLVEFSKRGYGPMFSSDEQTLIGAMKYLQSLDY